MSKWKMVRLGEVCEIISGTTPKSYNSEYWGGTINWITPAEIKNDTYIIYESERKITELAVKETGLKQFPEGTVILSSRAPIGKVAIAGKEMYCNQGFKNMICSANIDNKYLFWFLKSKTIYLNSLGRGATFKEISKAIVENVEIPLPPLDEQKRIAEELNKISGLIAKRKSQLEKLDLLVKAKFVEMFGDLGINPFEWELITLKECCNKSDDIKCGPFGTQLSKSEYQTTGIPLWGIPQINSFFRKKPVEFLLSEKAAQLNAYSLIHGDIAMSRKGNVGMCALFTEEHQPGIIHSDVLRIRSNANKVSSYFLMYQLHFSPCVRYQIESVSSGAIMAGINVSKLKDIVVHLPPLNLQNQFADYVTKVEQTKNKLQQGLEQLETLYKARLQEYFG